MPLLLAFLALGHAPLPGTTLEVYWVDVEGGAAAFIKTPAGESILNDTGNPGTRDAGRIHRVDTREAGLKKIDHLITSHFHGDHYGGAAILANLTDSKNCKGHFIKLSVSSDGKSYVILNSRNIEERKYRSTQ